MSLVDEQDSFLDDVSMLLRKAKELGFKRTAGELFRSEEQQAIYVKQGKSKVSHSRHQDKLAIDLNFFKDGVYLPSLGAVKARDILRPLGEWWESINPKNVWGGNFDRDWTKEDNFKDVPHFERRP